MTLIERLEMLDAPCGHCDALIAESMGIKGSVCAGPNIETTVTYFGYTQYIDCAVKLIPEGMHWQCGFGIEGENGLRDQAYAWASKKKRPPLYRAATPAIALCIAALKAVQS